MDKVKQQIERLVKQHGTLSAAAKAVGLQVSYMCLLRKGKRVCKDAALRKLGLERRIIIRRIK
jgi:hypothetical protein